MDSFKVIDGHDPRQIEVGVLSRYPIISIKSNRHMKTSGNAFLFPRDCLEIEVLVGPKSLYLYINHFTSMMKGRDESMERRKEQVDKVASLVDEKWAKLKYKGDFIVLGDFNDFYDENTSLKSLLDHPQLENVVKRLPKEEQWTHYFAGEQKYNQLDYILISKELSMKNPDSKPVIFRKGQPYRAKAYKGFRYAGVGEDRPKSSDHCPVYIDLIL
jgi:endonuclease/exonuclease/phosphatase family metal-dependent hydrolase